MIRLSNVSKHYETNAGRHVVLDSHRYLNENCSRFFLAHDGTIEEHDDFDTVRLKYKSLLKKSKKLAA